MSFIHPYLLLGLSLAVVPVLLHLIFRQKPKRLPFPAFRFLAARQKTNRRKMQLQHFLLLLLRMLVLAAICLALARPRLAAGRFGGDRPVVAVLLFDTSPSMEYAIGGVNRLDEARRRANELLDQLKPDSRLAILDAADPGEPTMLPVSEARARLAQLKIRPSVGPLNGAVERALRHLDRLDAGEEGPARLLHIFSDRTRNCWDAAGIRPRISEGVQVLFVDVGVELPRDLGIESVEVFPPVVPPGTRFEVRVTVRGTPGGHENELSCSLDNDPDPNRPADRRPVQLAPGTTSDLLVFERLAPQMPGGATRDLPCQLTLRLGTRDAMPFNNTRHATLLVRGGRKLLTLVEKKDRERTRIWEAALGATRSFECEVRTFTEADGLTARELGKYSVVALFETADVPGAWWGKLATYVRGGGGLAVVPGGEEVRPQLDNFNKRGLGAELLPAPFDRLESAPAGKRILLDRFSGAHPLLAPFVKWSRSVDPDFARDELRPFVRRYWKLGPLAGGALAITPYADAPRSPFLTERPLGRGKVIQFTTPLDFRFLEKPRSEPWTNFWSESSFGLILIDRVCRYLGGEVVTPRLDFLTGEVPQVTLSGEPQGGLQVMGPGLGAPERKVAAANAEGMVSLPQATQPGNYQIVDETNQIQAGFSLECSPREGDLDRVPTEELEAVLGPGTVLQVDRAVRLEEALATSRPPPLELLPYLMLLLLAVLTLESYLGNRFYRRGANGATTGLPSTPGANP